jgi:hypothetical protein
MGKLLEVALSLVPRTSSILKCHSIVSVGPCGPGSYITPITPLSFKLFLFQKMAKKSLKIIIFFSFFHFLKKDSSSCKILPPKKNHA